MISARDGEGLPKGWQQVTIGAVTEPVRIGVNPADFPTLPFVGMEHVEAETMRLVGTVPASGLRSNSLRFWPGDVLYGRLRPYLNKVLRPDFEGLCSAEFLVFPKAQHLQPGYLQYFLNSWRFKNFASRLNTGDRPRVDWEQLKGFGFPLPPLAEQRPIVEVIEQQFTRLDAGVAALKRAKVALKRYRAAVLKAAVEGRLTAAWRAEHPNVEPASVLLQRILAERRAKWEADVRAKGKDPVKTRYVAPEARDTVDLPELPEGWCYTLLSPLLIHTRKGMTTGPFGTLLSKNEHLPSGVPVLGIENIDSMKFRYGNKVYVSHAKAQELETYDALPGDVLISRSGTVGEVCVVPEGLGEARISTNLIRVSISKQYMLPQYFCMLFNGSPLVLRQVDDLCKGSTRSFLNQHILSSLVFPLPPLAEQEQIVAEVEQRLSIVSELEATIEANLKRADRLRQSILERAFAGKLVPQDPEDEPASVLLERIREQREGLKPHGQTSKLIREASTAIQMPLLRGVD